MSYQVTARKWRPQSFADMVGQETVTQTLRNALNTGRIAHAFLFSGVRGVGKTTTARILAKALNCHQGLGEEPCGECPSCLEITEGNSVDVHEIDAASNRGIDSIRELRESVRYGTARDRFKIYIVDEVHMLTNEAFNALLKTLEEPPAHVKFILATTELHKIPATIVSRCQKYEFKPLPFKSILERLRLITGSEEVEISEYALGVLATLAQGSMRDAQSALDQLIAFGGKQIRDEDVKVLLGVIDHAVVSGLIDAVCERDRGALIAGIQELTSSGVAAQMICSKLIERVRSLLVCRVAGWNEQLLQLPDSEKEGLLEQAKRFSELDLIRFYDVLNKTSNELKWHSQPNVHLEISLLKLVEVAQLSSIEEVIRELRSGETAPRVPTPTVRSIGARQESRNVSAEPVSAPRSQIGFARDSEAAPSQDTVRRFMDGLQKNFKSLYTQLRCASDVVYSDGHLRIRFPASEAIHASMLEDKRGRLSESFADIVGTQTDVEIQVEENVEKKAPVGNPADDPKVRAFLERFPGKVVVRKEFED
jgi:DNA polymerase-3 subunit gamma/tau